MRTLPTQPSSVWTRTRVLTIEILVAIAIVVSINLYAVHENDSWMPRLVVLKGGFWLVAGLLTMSLSVQKKRLQFEQMKRHEIVYPVFDSWYVGLTLGILGAVYGLSQLNGAFGNEFLPTGTGRIAVIALYALSGSVSFLWAMRFLAWSVERGE